MNRNKFPKKVVITSGMPNGNKPLHIGHISLFIWADFFARYMRDRIGNENVVFVCGTDGFGSSTEEKYRKMRDAGQTDLTLPEYVKNFHDIQENTLQKYGISLNRYYASCLQPALENHKKVSNFVFESMLKSGKLQKKYTEQFFDEKLNVVLNGRQVEGKCPIEGCCSEVGYADECSLGHQYSPRDLINPVSTLSKTVPTFKTMTNYYLSLDEFRDELMNYMSALKDDPSTHKFMVKEMRDYMSRPAIYVKLADQNRLQAFQFDNLIESATNEKRERVELIFENVASRDTACELLNSHNISYTTNKSLAPLRITGNAKWGVPVPDVDNETKDLTFYVWPESLWAPISFTKTYLEQENSAQTWQDFWCDKNSQIVQFLGEDNIYFYALAEPAIFMAVNSATCGENAQSPQLQMPMLVANKHILLNNTKASSSGSAKAPTADELLDFYTAEQLRCHFLGMNVNNTAYNFKSKVFSPEEFEKTGDPVVAQGNMLTNIFNRIVRSVIYTCQNMFEGKIPQTNPSDEIIANGQKIAEKYEELVSQFKFNEIILLLDEYFRAVNQDWATRSKIDDESVRKQLVADTLHAIKIGATLLHPIAPDGAELVAKYLKADDKLWNWDNINKTFAQVCPNVDEFLFLEPKFDFFKKHSTQL